MNSRGKKNTSSDLNVYSVDAETNGQIVEPIPSFLKASLIGCENELLNEN